MSNKEILLILGNQLFPLEHIEKTKVNKIFMAEDFGLTTNHKHHKLKILMFLCSMRQYKDNLIKNGYTVFYHSIDEESFNEKYEDKLLKVIKDHDIKKLKYFEIEDNDFEDKITNFINQKNIYHEIFQSPMFLTSRNDFFEFAKEQKKLIRMASFYQKIRTKMNILIDENNKPIGGKWSYDEDNRKKIPKNTLLPETPDIKLGNDINNLKSIINLKFKDHPGVADNLWMPTNREEALNWLDKFFEEKFFDFGNYEDAIISENNFLFHSAISPILNMGLLTPDEVIKKAIDIANLNSIPINSLEGFVRQIIGWREFIRGIYHYKGKEEKISNFWKHNRKLTEDWYKGTTGITPLDDAIRDCLKYGYTHHIPRLMIICNIMNLSKIDPNEIYKWFMEMFVDSSDWVMVPNVYGMGLFSDGGIFATKPYICGSAYFMKMMDFKKGEWCNTMDGLYWRFIDRNRKFFLTNPRLSMMVRIFDKMKTDRKKLILSEADKFIKQNTI